MILRPPPDACLPTLRTMVDFAAEGLLDGLEGAARSERLALLEQLADEGVPLSELRRTTTSGTILFLPADRVIVGPSATPRARSPSSAASRRTS